VKTTARRLTWLASGWFVFGILESIRTVILIVLAPQLNRSWSQWSTASRWTDLLLVISFMKGNAYPSAATLGPGFINWLQTWSASMAALSFIAALALYARAKWGRTIVLVAALFALIHPILGTVLGIYTLSLLLPARAAVEYQHIAGAQASNG
jgi:hypothetical protein